MASNPQSPPLTETLEKPERKGLELRYDAQALFQGQRQLVIRHQGQDYTLSITSNGKLILTK